MKQKGMVSTLTPTMLFTTFVTSPQLEAAAAVILTTGAGARGSASRPRQAARPPPGHGPALALAAPTRKSRRLRSYTSAPLRRSQHTHFRLPRTPCPEVTTAEAGHGGT